MVRLRNFRCEKCGLEKEFFASDCDLIKDITERKCKCGGKFKEFNFKNNSQRARIFDKKEDGR